MCRNVLFGANETAFEVEFSVMKTFLLFQVTTKNRKIALHTRVHYA